MVRRSTWREDDILDIYLNEIGRFPLLTAKEEKDLGWKIINDGDNDARNTFINSNLRLVIPYAKHYRDNGFPFLDSISAGNIGVVKAVDKFDPGKGCRFSTYARAWIIQSIRANILPITSQTLTPEELSRHLPIKEYLENLPDGREIDYRELRKIIIDYQKTREKSRDTSIDQIRRDVSIVTSKTIDASSLASSMHDTEHNKVDFYDITYKLTSANKTNFCSGLSDLVDRVKEHLDQDPNITQEEKDIFLIRAYGEDPYRTLKKRLGIGKPKVNRIFNQVRTRLLKKLTLDSI